MRGRTLSATMRTTSIVVAFCMLACSKPEEAKTAEVTPPAATGPVVPESAPAPTPPPADASLPSTTAIIYVATFHKSVLDECLEITVTLRATRSNAELPTADKVTADLTSRLGEEGTRISKPCAEQFKGRTVLASCLISQEVDGMTDQGVVGTMQARSLHYNFATVGVDDQRMQDCLKDGGQWEALDRESREFIEARLRYNSESLRDKLGK